MIFSFSLFLLSFTIINSLPPVHTQLLLLITLNQSIHTSHHVKVGSRKVCIETPCPARSNHPNSIPLSVSAITGSAEPIYGPEAFHSITDTIKPGQNPFGALTRQDLEWRAPWSSHVETQTFYFTSPTGHYGFAQIIHSNPVGLHFTAQFTCRVVHDTKPEDCVWTSTNLEDFEAKGTEFNAHNVSISLSEDATTYKISSHVNENSIVDFTVKRLSEGFKIGETGNSLYGEDPAAPWGSMRHVFWPRNSLNGTIKIGEGRTIEIKDGQAMYVMAMQGMKPHHAAARWNFVNFQAPTTSVVVMEFTTPASYGSCTVSVGGVTRDNALLFTSIDVKVTHLDAEVDEVGWPAPKRITFDLTGPAPHPDKDANTYTAHLSGDLSKLVERVDVMAEIPNFVKKVVAGVSGAKPYIYQFSDRNMAVKISNKETGEVLVEEKGHGFCETTFIS